MDEYTAVEMAYKNGYETALKDIASYFNTESAK